MGHHAAANLFQCFIAYSTIIIRCFGFFEKPFIAVYVLFGMVCLFRMDKPIIISKLNAVREAFKLIFRIKYLRKIHFGRITVPHFNGMQIKFRIV
ncbi:hypothetical protein SDC9_173465 [bioreactor metagenome]|uniref:Uncharacterized protein n=1 Tax=bioreactor metagenome TaxID=1076179 RepID=A0A645GQU1_9ZZZZ